MWLRAVLKETGKALSRESDGFRSLAIGAIKRRYKNLSINNKVRYVTCSAARF
jgi:hypothetical protein